MARLEIVLLGRLRFIADGVSVTESLSARMQNLLAYLALHGVAQRQELAFALWPDTSESQARANLRNLLHRLRQVWPASSDYIASSSHELRWQPSIERTVDVETFSHHLETASAATSDSLALDHLRQALASYQADLYPHCFEDWITSPREKLRQMFLQALIRTVNLCQQMGRSDEALHYAMRLRSEEPLYEPAYLRLIEIYLANENRSAALRTYHDCVAILRTELRLEPGAELQDLYQRVLTHHQPIDAPPTTPNLNFSAPLVGREDEWRRLQDLWQYRAAEPAQPMLVLVSGEAGIGKTRLSEEFLGWAKQSGATTAAAYCYEAGADLAYLPIIAWLRSLDLQPLPPLWRRELARLLPELEDMDLQDAEGVQQLWQQQRLFDAFVQAFAVQSRPMVLLLEDAQWCDHETLAWIRYLTGIRQPQSILLLVTVRTEAPQDHIQEIFHALERSDRAHRLHLSRLNAAQTAALVSLTGMDFSAEQVQALYQDTEGNPLFVLETLRAYVDHMHTEAHLDSASMHLLPKVKSVLTQRLGYLSAGAATVANVAAVIGRQFSYQILFAALDLCENELLDRLDELWQRHVIRQQGTEHYNFSHDKLRQLIYDQMSHARRRALHLRVAQAMAATTDEDPHTAFAVLAYHLEMAGHFDEAVAQYRQAARQARALFAYEDAGSSLQRALVLIPQLPARNLERSAIHEEIGDLLMTASKYPEAEAAFTLALNNLGENHALKRADLLRKQGNAWRGQAFYQESLTYYQLAREQLRQEVPGEGWWRTWLDLHFDLADSLYFLADDEALAHLCDVVDDAVSQHGTPMHEISFYNMRTQLRLRRSRFVPPAENIHDQHKILEIARRLKQPDTLAHALFSNGFNCLWHGEGQQAIAFLTEAADYAEQIAYPYVRVQSLAYLSIAHRLARAAEQVERITRQILAMDPAQVKPSYAGVAHSNLSWLAYQAGDWSAALAHGNQALRHWSDAPYPFRWLAAWILVAVHTRQGAWVSAIEAAKILLDPAEQLLPTDQQQTLQLAIAAWDRGDHPAVHSALLFAIRAAQANRCL